MFPSNTQDNRPALDDFLLETFLVLSLLYHRDVHLSFLFRNGLLLAAVYVLKALQEGQQRGARSLGGTLVVHLSGATFPQAQQQQNGRQQLTGKTHRHKDKVSIEAALHFNSRRIAAWAN